MPGRIQKGRRSEGTHLGGERGVGDTARLSGHHLGQHPGVQPSFRGPASSKSVNAGGMEGIAWQLFGSCLAQCHVPGRWGLLLSFQMPLCCWSPWSLASMCQEERVEMGASLA